MTTIYVGNLPFTATEDEVRSLFERYGKVDSVKLINDERPGVRAVLRSSTWRQAKRKTRFSKRMASRWAAVRYA